VNRRELVLAVAERTGSDRKTADAAVAAVTDSIVAAVTKGDIVTISGFAKFSRRVKPATKARKGTNPFTGEEMMFKAKPASKTVKVAPLKAFKDTVASGKVPAAAKPAAKKAAKKAPAKKAAAKKTVKKAAPKKTAKKAAKRR
jgi:DNA-binding protein HU-beta